MKTLRRNGQFVKRVIAQTATDSAIFWLCPLALAPYQQAYREMWIPSGPAFVEEHLRRLQARGIQPHFMLGDVGQLETVERLIRRGVYTGPLVLNWVGIGGGADGPNPRNLLEFVNRCPDNAVLTVESIMRNVLPLGTMAIAMGLHVRVGIEDNLWGRKGQRITSVQQVEQFVRIARELHRDVATGEDARRIYRIGEHWGSTDETLARLGYAPNRREGERGAPLRRAAQGRQRKAPEIRGRFRSDRLRGAALPRSARLPAPAGSTHAGRELGQDDREAPAHS